MSRASEASSTGRRARLRGVAAGRGEDVVREREEAGGLERALRGRDHRAGGGGEGGGLGPAPRAPPRAAGRGRGGGGPPLVANGKDPPRGRPRLKRDEPLAPLGAAHAPLG